MTADQLVVQCYLISATVQRSRILQEMSGHFITPDEFSHDNLATNYGLEFPYLQGTLTRQAPAKDAWGVLWPPYRCNSPYPW